MLGNDVLYCLQKNESSDKRKVLNNTTECMPLKNINSQPQGNLNQFTGDGPEYYDTSSVTVPHRTASSFPDNPPTKPKGCVTVVKVEVDIETEDDPCDTKVPDDTQKMDGDTKLPGNVNETHDAKVQDSNVEPTGGVNQPLNSDESNITKNPEGTKPCAGEETQDEPKPPTIPRPITSRPITPRVRFNLPPEPLTSVLPSMPPPPIPPRSPRVPPTTPKESGPEQS